MNLKEIWNFDQKSYTNIPKNITTNLKKSAKDILLHIRLLISLPQRK